MFNGMQIEKVKIVRVPNYNRFKFNIIYIMRTKVKQDRNVQIACSALAALWC